MQKQESIFFFFSWQTGLTKIIANDYRIIISILMQFERSKKRKRTTKKSESFQWNPLRFIAIKKMKLFYAPKILSCALIELNDVTFTSDRQYDQMIIRMTSMDAVFLYLVG